MAGFARALVSLKRASEPVLVSPQARIGPTMLVTGFSKSNSVDLQLVMLTLGSSR